MTKYFKNGKTFSAYCRMRYGQSKLIWDDPTLWSHNGRFAIAFDEEAADKKFAAKPVRSSSKAVDEDYDDERGLRQMEEMAAYIHSGAGLDNYYRDRDAGYAF